MWIETIGSSKSVIYGLRAGNNFNGNHGFECALRLLGVLRVLYRGYEQAVILMGIMDLWLLEVLRVLYRGYEQAVILVGIMGLRLLRVLRVLYRGYEQAVILVAIMDLNVNCDYWEF